jgi:hypothetical protein
MSNPSAVPYGFGRLVPECERRGISKSVAFKLQREGMIETFCIGATRYVRIASLESLPDRLQAKADQVAA